MDGDVVWVVSPYFKGTSLAQQLKAGSVPPPAEAAGLVAALAEALQFAHDGGIVHGDIKPSNVFLDKANRPHLVGFNWPTLTALPDCSDLGAEGALVGTVEYLAPELLGDEANPLDPRRDVYALGVILYELLTGRKPFQGTSTEVLRQITTTDPRRPRSFKRRIPQDLETICLKALQRDPSARYASAGALAEALRTYLGTGSSSTQRRWGFWK